MEGTWHTAVTSFPRVTGGTLLRGAGDHTPGVPDGGWAILHTLSASALAKPRKRPHGRAARASPGGTSL